MTPKPASTRHARCSLAALLLLNAVPMASAQVPDAGSLLRQQRDQAPAARPAARPADAALNATPTDRAAPALGGPLRVAVRAFRIQGQLRAFTVDQLLAVLAPWQGRTLTLAELNQAVDAVTQLYRRHHYPIARALLPRQDVTEGTVVIEVLEGLRDATWPAWVVDDGGLRLAPERAQALLGALLPAGEPLQGPALERAALLLSDLPGLRARLELEPGSTPGSTQLVARLQEGPLLSGVVGLDGHGARYTGAERLSALLQWNDAGGRGEQTSLQAAKSTRQTSLRLSHSEPVGKHGARAGLALGGLDYRIGEQLAALEAGGQALNANLNLRYPWLRSDSRNLVATAAWDASHLRNHANGVATSDKRLQSATLGLQGDRTDPWLGEAFTTASVQLALGRADLSGNAASLLQDQAPNGPHTHGHFRKLNLSFSHSNYLGNRLSLHVSALAQLSPDNLDSSEKMQLGGPNGVRAYPVGEASGDNGYSATIEARWQAGGLADLGSLQWQAFVDGGRIQQYAQANALSLGSPNQYWLAGWGLGAALTGGPGGLDLRLAWAQALGNNPGRSAAGLDADGRRAGSRFWFQLQRAF